jgi:DNA-binding transcriptional LysR family regulator
MANLRSLDLNLLTVFEAIFEAGSISRAADKLALSQSATSHALARLREACGDDLFVRIGQGIAPTAVASRLYPEVRKALDVLRRSLSEARGFDPATSSRRFEVAIPHPAGPLWALAMSLACRAQAPSVVLDFDTRTMPADQAARLRSGELDVAVDWLPSEDDRFVNRRLFDDQLVAIARRDHPRIAAEASLDVLRQERFVSIYPRARHVPDYFQDMRQAYEDLDLDIALLVNEALEVPFVVLQTDLVGWIPLSIARDVTGRVGLQIVQMPFPARPIPIYLTWHETRRADSGHQWLRELAAQCVVDAAKLPVAN